MKILIIVFEYQQVLSTGFTTLGVVCAAISILVQTLAIRLEDVTDKYTTHIEPGDVEITGEGIRAVDTFWTVFTGLKALSDSYPENVKTGAL